MRRLFEKPKALLPWWLLLALVAGGAFAGTAAFDGGAPEWVALTLTVAVAWGGAFAARRLLAGRGHRAFDDLPDGPSDYEADSVAAVTIARTLYPMTILLGGTLVGLLPQAAGIGGDELWGLPAWVLCGWVASVPAARELDARWGLRVARRRTEERRRVEQALAGPILAHEDTAPIRRLVALWWLIFTTAIFALMAALPVLVDGNVVGRAVLAIPALILTLGFAYVLPYLLAPCFVRFAPAGLEVLGRGTIPWEVISRMDLSAHSNTRWLQITLAEPLGDQPWATWTLRHLSRGMRRRGVQLALRFCAWPPERILVALAAAAERSEPRGIMSGDADAVRQL